MNRQMIASELVKIAKGLMAYFGDPFWVIAKYPGHCAKCGHPIVKGEKAFYYPKSRKLYGDKCGHGEDAAADFHAHAQDETMYNSSCKTAAKEVVLRVSDRLPQGMVGDVDSVGYTGREFWWKSKSGLKNAYSDKSKFVYSLGQELMSSSKAVQLARELKEKFDAQ